MVCKSCGSDQKNSASFCACCGASMVTDSIHELQSGGMAASDRETAKFNSAGTTDAKGFPKQENETDVLVVDRQPSEKQAVVCQTCGASISSAAKFCKFCGSSIGTAQESFYKTEFDGNTNAGDPVSVTQMYDDYRNRFVDGNNGMGEDENYYTQNNNNSKKTVLIIVSSVLALIVVAAAVAIVFHFKDSSSSVVDGNSRNLAKHLFDSDNPNIKDNFENITTSDELLSQSAANFSSFDESEQVETLPNENQSQGTLPSSNGSHSVQVTLSRIYIGSMPNKTTYYIGDSFNSSGLEVYAEYSDGNTYSVSGSISKPDLGSAGTKSVKVTYTDGSISKTTSFSITVETPYVTIDSYTNEMFVGDYHSFSCSYAPSGATVSMWSSSDTSVLWVDSNGYVEAVGSGYAYISCSIKYSGKTYTDDVFVEVYPNDSGNKWFEFYDLQAEYYYCDTGEIKINTYGDVYSNYYDIESVTYMLCGADVDGITELDSWYYDAEGKAASLAHSFVYDENFFNYAYDYYVVYFLITDVYGNQEFGCCYL